MDRFIIHCQAELRNPVIDFLSTLHPQFFLLSGQGCQIFLVATYQNGKIHQMELKLPK
jgi:hypothetical protein